MVASSSVAQSQDGNMTSTVKRFVPTGAVSLSEDAPGWDGCVGMQNAHDDAASETTQQTTVGQLYKALTSSEQVELGPICWKCKGSGLMVTKSKASATKQCSVCDGIGKLPSKKREREAKTRWGEITSPRRTYDGWNHFGPLPFAVRYSKTASARSDNERKATDLLNKAEQFMRSVEVNLSDFWGHEDSKESKEHDAATIPKWLPRKGEQLCNLVGNWRILQCVGSHRWTTDDLVTAFVASKQVESKRLAPDKSHKFRYIDLGTGNGSVLTMASWKISQILQRQSTSLRCVGIEARKEALALNRRSLAFNVGTLSTDQVVPSPRDPSSCSIEATVLHGDFRELPNLLQRPIWDSNDQDLMGCFDLVTGTPPYFRVDFHVGKQQDSNDGGGNKNVERAVIQQGGMPSCRQSAPARCEFRGGIEAYCQAAALALHPTRGVFCVCENWANHERVLQAAEIAGLSILEMQPVRGSSKKSEPLFCVYTMRIRTNTEGESHDAPLLKESLVVRDDKGKWTVEYATEVLEYMSIPAKHETDSTNIQG